MTDHMINGLKNKISDENNVDDYVLILLSVSKESS